MSNPAAPAKPIIYTMSLQIYLFWLFPVNEYIEHVSYQTWLILLTMGFLGPPLKCAEVLFSFLFSFLFIIGNFKLFPHTSFTK